MELLMALEITVGLRSQKFLVAMLSHLLLPAVQR
jgi:hypothetical protein